MKIFKSLADMYEQMGALESEDVDVETLIESLVNVNEGYSEHLQQLIADIRAEERDNMAIHILGEFGAMMAERGYERAKKDFGVE